MTKLKKLIPEHFLGLATQKPSSNNNSGGVANKNKKRRK